MLPKRRFGHDKHHAPPKRRFYPSQTKILEGLTKGEIKIFDIPFKGVSTRFGLQTIEKYIENLDFIFCQSFQNLRLGSIHFDKNVNHESRLTLLSKCSKWRLSKKRGLVAYGW